MRMSETHLIARRLFFKKMGKVLAFLTLPAMSTLLSCEKDDDDFWDIKPNCTDCSHACRGTCYSKCTSTCKETCTTMCADGCSFYCRTSCGNDCQKSCKGDCSNSCRGDCSGYVG